MGGTACSGLDERNGLESLESGIASLESVLVMVIGDVSPFSFTGVIFFMAGDAEKTKGLAFSVPGRTLPVDFCEEGALPSISSCMVCTEASTSGGNKETGLLLKRPIDFILEREKE
jgi:hypothetical protein